MNDSVNPVPWKLRKNPTVDDVYSQTISLYCSPVFSDKEIAVNNNENLFRVTIISLPI